MKEKNENQFKLTDFDYLTARPKLQMLKAAEFPISRFPAAYNSLSW